MPAVLGLDAKIYYQDATNATVITDTGRLAWPSPDAEPPGLTELDNVRNVTINLEKGEADITTRGAGGWRNTVGTLKDGTVEFEMVWDTSDAGFTAIKDAYFDSYGVNTDANVIACAILDGSKAVDGSQGLWGDFTVTNFSRNEPLEEAMTVNVSLKLTRGEVSPFVPPEWVTTDAP